MDAKSIIEWLDLKPLDLEGGHFRETYRSEEMVGPGCLDSRYGGPRSVCTAIYYLLTPETFSALHRVKSDEIFHFYAGDPVEMVQLHPDGHGERVTLGSAIDRGHVPQCVVKRGVWQGCRLTDSGSFALMGTTVAPGFEYADFELANRQELIRQFPKLEKEIVRLTRE
jgi:predicted cupin superfamily sugar epimerase